MDKNKRIITCSVTGSIHTPSMSEFLPITPEQIANNALGAAEAGAAVVHIHARNPETGQISSDLKIFEDIIGRIRDKNKELIICITTGGGQGMTVAERAAVVPHFKPELASCNLGSMNWGVFPLADRIKEFKTPWEEQWFKAFKSYIFPNTFEDIQKLTGMMNEAGTKTEFECYDVGHLNSLAFILEAGYIKPPVYVQFCTGILGGIPATPYALMDLHNTAERVLGRKNYTWSAFGTGRNEFSICTMALLLGGNIRVGMEDNLYLSKGVKAKNNAELVKKMVRIMGELELQPARPQEAREMLGLN